MSLAETQPLSPRAYRVNDLVPLIGLSPAAIWNLIFIGRLKAKKMSAKATVIPAEDLDAFLARLADQQDARWHRRSPPHKKWVA